MPIQPSDEEERYFNALEIEQRRALREKLEDQAQDLAEKRKIAADVKTDDMEIVDQIKALGFDGDSAAIFDLMPLVHVAWADGKIQKGERASILGVLVKRGIAPGSKAFQTMESMLEERPSQTFMDESMRVLQKITQGLGERQTELADLCISVANASGGFLGLGHKISDEERAMIEEILQAFGPKATTVVGDGLR